MLEADAHIKTLLDKFNVINDMCDHAVMSFERYWVKKIKIDRKHIPDYQMQKIKETALDTIRGSFANEDLVYQIYSPVYKKYYSEDDLKTLVDFYDSDLGKKVMSVTPAVNRDSVIASQEWMEANLFPQLEQKLSSLFKQFSESSRSD